MGLFFKKSKKIGLSMLLSPINYWLTFINSGAEHILFATYKASYAVRVHMYLTIYGGIIV